MILYTKSEKGMMSMSINDLMEAVRDGKFENEFKKCESIEEKIKLFKSYGINISSEQYREIEERVRSIKEGECSVYNEDDYFNKGERVFDSELYKVSAGSSNQRGQDTVLEVLKRIQMPESKFENSDKSDGDVKKWDWFKRGLF